MCQRIRLLKTFERNPYIVHANIIDVYMLALFTFIPSITKRRILMIKHNYYQSRRKNCTIGINVFRYERDIVLLVCKMLEVEPQQYKSL